MSTNWGGPCCACPYKKNPTVWGLYQAPSFLKKTFKLLGPEAYSFRGKALLNVNTVPQRWQKHKGHASMISGMPSHGALTFTRSFGPQKHSCPSPRSEGCAGVLGTSHAGLLLDFNYQKLDIYVYVYIIRKEGPLNTSRSPPRPVRSGRGSRSPRR